MKSIVSLMFILLLITSCTNNTDNNQQVSTVVQSEMVNKQLRHIVLFQFKETATDAEIEKIEAAFIALPSKIKEIKDFEWGLNNSPEGLEKGFTHCFFVTFDSEAGREVYLPHPDHKAFVALLEPVLEDVLVLDYWTK
jgi:hypothetical protein